MIIYISVYIRPILGRNWCVCVCVCLCVCVFVCVCVCVCVFLEVGCTFVYSLEEAFLTNVLKYQQLKQTISQLGYKCKLLIFIFGSLGNVHKLCCEGPSDGRPLPKEELARYCSVSAIIGSRSVWRRRCFLYP